MSNVKSLFKICRQKTNLNQKDFADRLGISQNNLSKYETGTTTPPSDVMYQLFEIVRQMGFTIDELFIASQIEGRTEITPDIIDKLDFKSYQKIEETKIAVMEYPFIVRTNKGTQTGEAGDGLVCGKEGNYYRIPKKILDTIYSLKQ
ncbi:MAG: hypothetical protein OMM_08357 [Candidatus Magnetoglobus multicellularis str. Araruama]|uniref:HTH cro/C1-type domain-containing protein n=1 Tax=Candidatus Magnetoglobus multicellularis str. Araruama TaxID=890399 RepID=A0A1V1P8H1_9BACT|nr:MAG: hypothetical protein OMM_08357 [Candidatus Magnetoglobus multicellularis str. Araruama]